MYTRTHIEVLSSETAGQSKWIPILMITTLRSILNVTTECGIT